MHTSIDQVMRYCCTHGVYTAGNERPSEIDVSILYHKVAGWILFVPLCLVVTPRQAQHRRGVLRAGGEKLRELLQSFFFSPRSFVFFFSPSINQSIQAINPPIVYPTGPRRWYARITRELVAHPVPDGASGDQDFAEFLSSLLMDHTCVPHALVRGVMELEEK